MLTALAETSPNGREYDTKVGELYFVSINAGNLSRPDYAKMLVDADYIENLVIPDSVDGMRVVRIADGAFKGRIDIESVVLNPSLKTLGENSFRGCKYITKLDMSATTDLYGWYSFRECSGIELLEIPKGLHGNYPFYDCSGVRKIIFKGIPGSVSLHGLSSLEEIDFCEGMKTTPGFGGAEKLTKVSIPASVESISNETFSGCSGLSEVIIPDDSKLEIIGARAFARTCINSINLPDKVFHIGGGAFAGTKFTEFRLPAGLKSDTLINSNKYETSLNSVFSDCADLKKIIYNNNRQLMDIPPCLDEYRDWGRVFRESNENLDIYVNDKPVEEIVVPGTMELPVDAFALIGTIKKVKLENSNSSHAFRFTFQGCKNLESVEIGAGAPDLETTFFNCENLRTVTVSPKNRTEKLHQTFNGCKSLESISFPNVNYLSWTFENCSSLKNVDLPEVEFIEGGETFAGCTSLEEISLPKFVQGITSEMFKNCTSLRKVNLPSCTALDRSMFSECTSLSDITLGNVTVIPNETFLNCEALASFDFSTIKEIGRDAFNNTGLTSVKLNPGVRIYSGNPFSGCKNLKSFAAEDLLYGYYDTDIKEGIYNLSDLPGIEEIIIGGTINDISIWNSFKEKPGRLILNGDVASCEINSCDSLSRVEFNGDLKNCSFNNSWLKEISFKSIESILNADYFEKYMGFRTPGWQYDEATIDLFINGQKISDLEIPAGTEIKENTFKGMNIEKVTFLPGEDETIVGPSAFSGCTNLKEIDIQGNVTTLGANAFRLTGIESFDMPDCVTSLGSACFQRNPNLRHITFSPSLKTIPGGIVHNCPLLENVIIPEGVESVGDRLITYEWNPNVKIISLPSTLKSLYTGQRASFDKIPTDIEILCWAKTPPNSGVANFDNNTVHVPSGCADVYKRHRMWTKANIVDDLATDNIIESAATAISVTIPVNTVGNGAKVNKYVVVASRIEEDGSETVVGTFEFDANGELLKPSRSNSASITLTIPELEENTNYSYEIKGFTTENDLIYSLSGKASTTSTSALDNIFTDNNFIKVVDQQLVISPELIGQTIAIYSVNGQLVYSTEIIDSTPIELPLQNGIYIVRIAGKSVKVII